MSIYVPGKLTLRKEFQVQDYMWLFPQQYGLWSPAEITTALWLDAADSSTIIESGGAVSQWNDKSGNGRNAIQSDSDFRPAYVNDELNGLSVARFDGSNDRMELSNTAALANSSNSIVSIFVVGRQSSGTNGTFLSKRQFQVSNGWTLRNNSTTQVIYFHTGFTPSVTNASPPGYYIAEVLRNGNSVQLGVDGIIASAVEINGYAASPDNIFAGAENTGSFSFLNGEIAEVVISASVLDQSNRQRIEGYLAHKWGLTGNLPSDHPYKTVGPTP